MNKLSHFFFQSITPLKSIINWVFYLIFAGYLFSLIRNTPALPSKVFYGLIGLVVLTIIGLFEWLKHLYRKMISALTFECDIKKARALKKDLITYDLFKGFRPSLILFDSLLLLDSGAYKDCLSHMTQHHDFFRGSTDYLLIMYRTQLQCAYFLGDSDLFDASLSQLSQLKRQQTKQSALYSWPEIKGLQFFRHKRFSQAQKTLADIPTTTFNLREECYLLFERAQVNYGLANFPEANRLLKEVVAQGNQLHITELAKRKEWISFEEHH